MTEILAVTGLKLGAYGLAQESSNDCEPAELALTGEPGDLTLMNGARALILGLGTPAQSWDERSCKYQLETAYQRGEISSVLHETCAGSPIAVYHHRIQILDDFRIRYSHHVLVDNAEQKAMNCLWIKQQ